MVPRKRSSLCWMNVFIYKCINYIRVKNEKLKASDIRQKYIDFFVEKGHMVEPSAPLVPIDDDSLLWINSGVATLKNTLMDEKHLKA